MIAAAQYILSGAVVSVERQQYHDQRKHSSCFWHFSWGRCTQSQKIAGQRTVPCTSFCVLLCAHRSARRVNFLRGPSSCLPLQPDAKGVKVKISDHVDDIRSFAETVLPGRRPVFVSHRLAKSVGACVHAGPFAFAWVNCHEQRPPRICVSRADCSNALLMSLRAASWCGAAKACQMQNAARFSPQVPSTARPGVPPPHVRFVLT